MYNYAPVGTVYSAEFQSCLNIGWCPRLLKAQESLQKQQEVAHSELS